MIWLIALGLVVVGVIVLLAVCCGAMAKRADEEMEMIWKQGKEKRE